MHYEEFLLWLQKNHGMSVRSARDVVSRSRRALAITGQKSVDSKSMDLLTESGEFIECSISIKSQLKRAVTLYMEYLKFCKAK